MLYKGGLKDLGLFGFGFSFGLCGGFFSAKGGN